MANINGGEGNDKITGTSGADTIVARDGDDIVDAGSGDDTISGGQGADVLNGGEGDDRIYSYNLHEDYYSRPIDDGLSDKIDGGSGNDRILIGGDSTVDGGDGDDFVFQYNGNLVSSWTDGINRSRIISIWHPAWWDLLHVTGFPIARPTITGGTGDDQIFVQYAASIDAGDGNDIVIANSNNSDSSIGKYNGGNGYDRLIISAPEYGSEYKTDFSKISDFEEISLTSTFSASLILPDVLAGSGKIMKIGLCARNGNGNTITIDASNETDGAYLFEHGLWDGDGAIDAAYRLHITGGQNADVINGWILEDVLVGSGGDDVINAFSGSDTIEGGAGDDTIDGGDGKDAAIFSGNFIEYTISEITYNKFLIVDTAGRNGVDTITDVNKLQFDDRTFEIVIRGIEIAGDDTAEELSGTAEADRIDGAGGDDKIAGGLGNDTVDGGSGTDDLHGDAGNDFLNGDAGNDTLAGGDGNDQITGGDGDDTVNAGGGDDLIIGGNGAGNDTYKGGSGNDTVKYTSALASITVDLSSSKDHARSTAGNDAAGIGIDQLFDIESVISGQYNDHLIGNSESNSLNGWKGADRMFGGAGDDTYYVDDSGDRTYETATAASSDKTDLGGTDTVRSSIGYTLGRFFEHLTLTGSANLAGTGNALVNTLIGNDGANTLKGLLGNDTLRGGAGNDKLDGGAGADIMFGGSGNDIYFVENTSDRVYETATIASSDRADLGGKDTVNSSVAFTLGKFVESLTLTGSGNLAGIGNELANTLLGNAGANTLKGLSGNDILKGGAGNDTLSGGHGKDALTGGTGKDTFIFDTAPTSRDSVTDFSAAEGDKIQLSKAVFKGFAYTGTLHAEDFYAAAGATKAQDATDRVIYNTTTGILYYDADGTGGAAAVQVALLGASTHPALAYGDLQIIA
jgi:Ca2+-binding RTX toxin-like protein